MKFFALTSNLLARIKLTLMSSLAMPVVFKKSIFRNLTYILDLCIYVNFEFPSAFLYALCELLEEQAVLYGNNRSSGPEVFCKKGILRSFAKFTGKHPARDSFLIMLQASPCTPFFTEHLRWLLLKQ